MKIVRVIKPKVCDRTILFLVREVLPEDCAPTHKEWASLSVNIAKDLLQMTEEKLSKGTYSECGICVPKSKKIKDEFHIYLMVGHPMKISPPGTDYEFKINRGTNYTIQLEYTGKPHLGNGHVIIEHDEDRKALREGMKKIAERNSDCIVKKSKTGGTYMSSAESDKLRKQEGK